VRHPGADGVIVAIGGLAGLDVSLAAARSGRVLVMGCKEALVAAGDLLMREVRDNGSSLRPLDSEHVAAQALMDLAGGRDRVARLVLTGSGGSVRDVAPDMRAGLDVARVLNHPVWRMGPKITVDSATLVNKALEVVEAGVLFGLDADRIAVALDPTARIHAAVETVDGGYLVFVAPPDMAIPVGLALGHDPHDEIVILEGHPAREAIARLGALDPEQESVVNLGRDAQRLGGTAAMVLVAADEVAVEAFLDGRLSLPGVPDVVRRTLDIVGSWAACLDPLSRDDLNRTATRAMDVARRHVAGSTRDGQ
jgi:1-deoxy-D-xylulose-5-phosphate reductoisomerase